MNRTALAVLVVLCALGGLLLVRWERADGGARPGAARADVAAPRAGAARMDAAAAPEPETAAAARADGGARLAGGAEGGERRVSLAAAPAPDAAVAPAAGLAIAGEVRRADGLPASSLDERAFVRAERGASEWTADIDPDGRFELTGLEPGTYRLRVQAVEAERVPLRSEITGRDLRRTDRTRLVAEAEVEAGTRGVVLVLSEGLALTGRVLDPDGVPLEGARVSARPRGAEPERSLLFRNRSPDAETDADGRFRLAGLTSGTWRVEATLRDRAPSVTLVELPAAGPIALVLVRGARASGVVIDASGTPVADAEVRALGRGEAPDAVVERSERTDARGAFRFEDLGPGPVLFGARSAGHAPSGLIEGALAEGDELDGIVLRLEPAAHLAGEVVGADGRALTGVPVRFEAPGVRHEAHTGLAGEFAFDDLPAGGARVSTVTSEGELAASVRLRAGETTRVRLAPVSLAVRLRGRATAGGEPLPGAELRASRIGGDDASFAASAVADDDGEYALVLPGAGRYWLAVHAREPELGWQVPVDVPDVPELEHDLDVPLARITGRVTDAVGNPLAGIEVRSEPEQHEHGRHGSAAATSAEDGGYALSVPPGRHAVVARGDAERSEARRPGIVVGAGEERGGIDLVLRAGGVLEGVVRRTDGAPAPGVEVLTTGARSRSLGRTDEAGRFRAEGLEPGPLALVATTSGAASRPRTFVIRAGEACSAELELLPATELHITVRDAAGTRLGSDLEVHAEDGAQQVVQSGDRAGDVWVGPLLPGRYLVRARRDVHLAERRVDVNGEERLEVEVVFE